LGGIVFIDLRDRSGIVQVAIGPGAPEEVRRAAAGSGGSLSGESVVEVEGKVSARPANMKNPELATGDVEVQATKLAVVGPAVTPAIPVARGKGEALPAEELRLRYRHLDLRRPEMQANLILRHRLLHRLLWLYWLHRLLRRCCYNLFWFFHSLRLLLRLA
jgi:aspartyl-tRNA synthetase